MRKGVGAGYNCCFCTMNEVLSASLVEESAIIALMLSP